MVPLRTRTALVDNVGNRGCADCSAESIPDRSDMPAERISLDRLDIELLATLQEHPRAGYLEL